MSQLRNYAFQLPQQSQPQQSSQQDSMAQPFTSPMSDHLDFADTFANNFASPKSSTSPLPDFDDFEYQSVLSTYDQHQQASSPSPMSGGYTRPISMTMASTSMDQNMDGPYAVSPPITSMVPMGSQPIQMKNTQLRQYQQQLSQQQPQPQPFSNDYVQMAGSPTSSGFPMSAPAKIGYPFGHFGSPPVGSASSSNGSFQGQPGMYQFSSLASYSSQAFQPTHDMHQGGEARSYDDDYNQQMSMQVAMEKRRRRRESHNAVERRRRDHINDRIQELGALLSEAGEDLSAAGKSNKGVILRKSVDFMRHLQQEVQTYSSRVEDLERTLAQLTTGNTASQH